MQRAASTPFILGMWTSRNATDLRTQLVEQLDRLAAVARLRDHLQLGPEPRQVRRELLTQQRLVVGDERGRRRHVPDGVTRISARTPRGCSAESVTLAAGEKNACRRSWRLRSPVPVPAPSL